MKIISSILNKFRRGRMINVHKNSEAGIAGDQIDIKDKVCLSSGSGEEKNSMTLKDAAISGGVGFAIGLGMGNSGRIKELENQIKSLKFHNKMKRDIGFWNEEQDGPEPSLTPLELKAIKMMCKDRYKKYGGKPGREREQFYKDIYKNVPEARTMEDMRKMEPETWLKLMKMI